MPETAQPSAVTAELTVTPKKTVKVYIRLGDHNSDDQREIAFRIPDEIDPMDLLDHGFAIDGNRATFTIAEEFGYVGPNGDEGLVFRGPFEIDSVTLSGALAQSQRALVEYLRSKGFAIQFD